LVEPINYAGRQETLVVVRAQKAKESGVSKELIRRIQDRKAVVGVIGLGYVGLPLVREFVRAGLKVVGFDIDQGKIDKLMAGKSYIEHIPSSMVKGMLAKGLFRATSNFNELSRPDVIIIAVPTPLTKMRDPDMTYIEATAHAISKRLRQGQLVVLESTTYPGTTREVMLPILEQSGLKAGKDFYLAFSPEREDPGRKDYSTRTIPKVVGGYDRASLDAACAVYSAAVQTVVPVTSCEAAEACKILENTYRCVNIALVNELKQLFDRMGIDVWEVIRAAATKPFGFQAFYPGPGLGGHCIPIDPFYLSWKAREYGMQTRFIELAGEVNVAMPLYVISRLVDALSERGKPLKGSRVLVLGLAYKKDIDDLRESPSLELIEILKARGAKVDYNDPHIPHTHKQREHDLKMRSVPITPAALRKYDAVIISTDHSTYDYAAIVRSAQLVVDTRNATAKVRQGRRKIVKA
jgi:UDP-N-acetyl-D-glucosamine dehydrogenase